MELTPHVVRQQRLSETLFNSRFFIRLEIENGEYDPLKILNSVDELGVSGETVRFPHQEKQEFYKWLGELSTEGGDFSIHVEAFQDKIRMYADERISNEEMCSFLTRLRDDLDLELEQVESEFTPTKKDKPNA